MTLLKYDIQLKKYLLCIDPATRYIYDNPSYTELLIPMLRADAQVTVSNTNIFLK